MDSREAAAYEQLANELRDAIVVGRLPPGEALPSVRALAQQYEVTNVTASRAVDKLRSEGLVDKGVPVVRILRTTYATDGRAVEVADQILAGDRYVLCYETPARTIAPEASTT